MLRMLRLAPLILRNVLRNRRRSLLTLASTAVSLAVLGLLVALYQGFFFAEQTSPSEALRLITRHKVSLTNPLPASHQARIAAIDGVEAVSAWSWFEGKYKDEKPENFFARFAVDPVEIQKVRPDYVAPPEQWAAFQAQSHRLRRRAQDRRQARHQARRPRPHHGRHLSGQPRTDRRDDLRPPEERRVPDVPARVPERADEGRRGERRRCDTVGTYAILAQLGRRRAAHRQGGRRDVRELARADQDRKRARVRPVVHGVPGQHQAVPRRRLRRGDVHDPAGSANTIAMSVRERTREIGILRTLGYTPGEILRMVLGESVLIALLGGLRRHGRHVRADARMAAAGMGPWGADGQVPLGSAAHRRGRRGADRLRRRRSCRRTSRRGGTSSSRFASLDESEITGM